MNTCYNRYLTHEEMFIVKLSYDEYDPNPLIGSPMAGIIKAHTKYKKDELKEKLDNGIISIFRHYLLINRVEKQASSCEQAMDILLNSRDVYYNKALVDFENSIKKLDSIGSKITRNPFIFIPKNNYNTKGGFNNGCNVYTEYYMSSCRHNLQVRDVFVD